MVEHQPSTDVDNVTPLNSAGHKPVLFDETLDYLRPKPGSRFIDGTFGGGGHTRELLKRTSPDGTVLGIDADPDAIARSHDLQRVFPNRLVMRQGNFRDIERIATEAGYTAVDGVLLDVGVSSFQLDSEVRGFAFRYDAPLDMRFDPVNQSESAADIVNTRSPEELAKILWEYGEERNSRRIARAIERVRSEHPIETTRRLVEVVETVNRPRREQAIAPATRTFQALRIAVNNELVALEAGIRGAINLLKPGGRLVVISFHSLEDRVTKQLFRHEARDCICPPELPVCRCDHQAMVRILTGKPVQSSSTERDSNPRSRSARLRALERL